MVRLVEEGHSGCHTQCVSSERNKRRSVWSTQQQQRQAGPVRKLCVVGRRGGLVGAALDTQPRREERRQGDVASPLLSSRPHLMNHLATKNAHASLVQWYRAYIHQLCVHSSHWHPCRIEDDIKDIIRKMAGGAERPSRGWGAASRQPRLASPRTHSLSTLHSPHPWLPASAPDIQHS